MRMGLGLFICLISLGFTSPGQTQDGNRAIQIKPVSAQPIDQEARIALVIGNGAYKNSHLKNPGNDACDMAKALQGCGFQVDLVLNADRTRMFKAVRDFGQKLNGGGVGLFYFAGHGLAVKGINYLIPVDTDIYSEEEVEVQALSVQSVLNKMEAAKNRLNLIILDACRNNPFGSGIRSGNQGLAQMDAPSGTFIAYATAPGSIASDGDGSNGLYTHHLLMALTQPGIGVEQVFKQVRIGVKQDSGNKQLPWDSSSLTGDFYFRPGKPMDIVVPTTNLKPAQSASNEAETYYLRGMDFYRGRGVPKDFSKALINLIEAADDGHAEAQATLGDFYLSGIGTFIDGAKATEYYLKAAERGNPRGLHGVVAAYLGEIHGSSLERNSNKAFEASRQSADQGNWMGLYDLARMYSTGIGVGRDDGRGLLLYRKALSNIQSLAEKNDLEACCWLGKMYLTGTGVSKNDTEAAIWFSKAADLGDQVAQTRLGWMFENGIGVIQNDQKALEWYRKAADIGDNDARNGLGAMYQAGKGVRASQSEAANWFRKAAEQGHAMAQFNLASLKIFGIDGPISDSESAAWFRKAADQGVVEAMNSVGVMYAYGTGVPQSYVEAAGWYRKAAEKGYDQAQRNLGEMYESGKGVPQSDSEAVVWYRKAAVQGHWDAQDELARMYLLGKGVTQSDLEAFTWFGKSAEQGYFQAQYHLGWMYQNGKGVSKNNSEAAFWYRKAAEKSGLSVAITSLGLMYQNGTGVPQSDIEAVGWYRKAAKSGDAQGLYLLGVMYLKGRGLAKNDKEAVTCFRKAADQGHGLAEFNLGLMYKSGRGVPKDLSLAREWFTKAAENGVAEAKTALLTTRSP